MNAFVSATLHPLLRSLAWALLHSLWQGAFLGLGAWLLLRGAGRRGPVFRYRVACSALGLMVLLFMGTLWGGWQTASPEAQGVLELAPLHGGGGAAALPLGTLLRAALEPRLPWVILAWGLGCTFMVLRLAGGLFWLHGPCLKDSHPAPARWEERLQVLARGMGQTRRVLLRVSGRVDSPLALGWFRPVVLLPAGVLLALDPLALEAVLVHELAHIRRQDYLANLLQSLAETLFFYHPAVWWLGRQIRQERELCCDDAAVRSCGDPHLYASALADLEALRQSVPVRALPAPAARGGSLMHRIKRILLPASAPHTLMPISLAGLALALLLGGPALVAQGQTPKGGGKGDGKTASSKPAGIVQVIIDKDFSQIKVRKQPPAPPYPAQAKADRIQGTVVVMLTIDTKGEVEEAKALEGPEALRECAVNYAKQWLFEPAKQKGKPVKARFKLTMPFKLK